MIRLIEDGRIAVQHLNYANPVDPPDPRVPYGPNLLKEWFWPVEISEDGKRIGFSYIAPRPE